MPKSKKPILVKPNREDPSNLENLKKQAKQYLRWHRTGYYPVAARIRAVLPRFRLLSDEQVLKANFKLADAQELLAREMGFEGWQALKSESPGMPGQTVTRKARRMAQGSGTARETSSTPKAPSAVDEQNTIFEHGSSPILSATEAQLYVADFRASSGFYTEKLGFTIAFTYGDPPFYGQVVRNHARLNLRMVGEPVFAGNVREREHLLSATLTLATAKETKQLFLSYRAVGVRFHQTLKKEPWGARTFVVLDPDGNLILFAGPAD